ncbi:hypothetical protein [Haloarcula sp. Atlit-7R]|uniref:hypothetical protein n=1 Tax=Haloarcula sp. Atlit-7R TaxID=2282125 RepID=UPI0018F60501|nr:hypothetical protein [Haloarcula sp. Atlit-7R]
MSEYRTTDIPNGESEIHDEPRIRDQRVTVSHIHTLVEERSLDAQTGVDCCALNAAEVSHVLAYYHDHREEM